MLTVSECAEINRQFQVRGAAAENGSNLDTGNYLDI